MTIDLTKYRFIPGAPAGVCATRIPARFFIGQPCEECGKPIVDKDKEVWYCSYSWLGKKKKLSKTGCAVWHEDCLKSAPISVAFMGVEK